MKLLSYGIACGSSVLTRLEQNSKRQYLLDGDVAMAIITDKQTIRVRTHTGFLTDMRSGHWLADLVVPHLGTKAERFGWWFHDALSYETSVSFDDLNEILRQYLRVACGYSRFRAWLVWKFVSASRSWYGPPAPDSQYASNVSLVDISVGESV